MREKQTRLVVIGTVYHQRHDQPPTAVAESYCHWLESDRLADLQELEVGGEWQPLDCARVGHPSLVVLLNLEGRQPQVVLTEEEKVLLAGKVVEVGFSTSPDSINYGVSVRPGESQRLSPAEGCRLFLRCRGGTARVVVHLFPS